LLRQTVFVALALLPPTGGLLNHLPAAWLSLLLFSMIAAAVVFLLSRYNALVRSHQRVQEAWAVIDAQLRRRASLLPNVIEVVRGYAQQERDVFEQVARARGAMQAAAGAVHTAIASNLLSQALGRLVAVVENYPQLSASAKFMTLRQDLRDIEDKIAFARAFYNRHALDYNTRIENYPVAALAVHFGFARAELFEVAPTNAARAE
jgi:LemA protein